MNRPKYVWNITQVLEVVYKMLMAGLKRTTPRILKDTCVATSQQNNKLLCSMAGL